MTLDTLIARLEEVRQVHGGGIAVYVNDDGEVLPVCGVAYMPADAYAGTRIELASFDLEEGRTGGGGT